MKLSRVKSLSSYALIVTASMAIAVTVYIEEQGRGDWISGPILQMSLMASIPVYLVGLMAVWFGPSHRWRFAGLIVGGSIFVPIVFYFLGYMGCW